MLIMMTMLWSICTVESFHTLVVEVHWGPFCAMLLWLF
jgi:hypothetical protein